MNDFILIFEIIGTIAFAISGALTAIRNQLDLFGIIALGIISSTAGGVLRDVILGSFPPNAFIHPIYVITAALVSVIVFLVVKDKFTISKRINSEKYKLILLLGDSIGLGIFTTVGVHTAILKYGADNGFLCVFSGLVTGVGGGVLRDMMIHVFPDIFRKHIYALASIIGAIVSLYLFRYTEDHIAIYIGSIVVIVIRLLAAHYRWSLPRIQQ